VFGYLPVSRPASSLAGKGPKAHFAPLKTTKHNPLHLCEKKSALIILFKKNIRLHDQNTPLANK